MGGAILSKSLIQFSVDEWGCVPSLLFDLRPNYGGVNEDNGNLLQKAPCMHCCTQCPQPLDMGYLFLVGSNILLSMVCSASSFNFGVLIGEDEPMFLNSTILY